MGDWVDADDTLLTIHVWTEAGAATVVPFEDTAGVAAAMSRIISDHRSGCLANRRDWSAIDMYDRRAVAAAFADCLAAATNKTTNAPAGVASDDVSASRDRAPIAATETVGEVA